MINFPFFFPFMVSEQDGHLFQRVNFSTAVM